MSAPVAAARSAPVAQAPLLREQVDRIAILILNRPEARNALSEAMLAALGEAFAAIATDRGVRGVVLAANGPATTSRSLAPAAPTPTAGARTSSKSWMPAARSCR